MGYARSLLMVAVKACVSPGIKVTVSGVTMRVAVEGVGVGVALLSLDASFLHPLSNATMRIKGAARNKEWHLFMDGGLLY